MMLDEIEPWSDRRLDLLYAGLVAWMINTSFNRPKDQVSPEAFIPKWWDNVNWEGLETPLVTHTPAQAMVFPEDVIIPDEDSSDVPSRVHATKEDAERLFQKIMTVNAKLGGKVVEH